MNVAVGAEAYVPLPWLMFAFWRAEGLSGSFT